MIYKYQQGGPSIFAQYSPFAATQTTQPDVAATEDATTKSSKSDDGLKEKDLMNLLGKIDGLPADMNGVIKNVSKLIKAGSLTGDPGDLTTIYLKALQQVKTASFYKKQFDNAYKAVGQNKGTNEYAITDSGKVVVMGQDGKISTKSLEELKDNDGTFSPITNAQLLNLRANDQRYAYDQTLLEVVENGIGMEKVSQLIKGAMGSIGSSSTTAEGYTQKEQDQITKGIEFLQSQNVSEALQSGMSLNGIYKNSMFDKNSSNQAKHALSYIWGILPENAKTLLKIKTDGTKEGACNLIAQHIAGIVSDDQKFTANRILDENGEKPGSKTKESEDKSKENLLTDIIKGKSGAQGTFTLKDEDGRTFIMNGIQVPNLSVNPSKPLNEGTLKELMVDGHMYSAYKSGDYAITFGNQELTDVDMENITFVNDGKAIRTILPVIRNTQGKLVPDLEFMKNHQDIIDIINSKQGNFNDPSVKSAMMEAGIISPVTGQPDMTRFQSFLCVNGMGTSRNIKDNEFATEIKGDSLEQRTQQFLNGIYKQKKENSDKKFDFNFDSYNALNPFDWFDNYDKLYEGTIFIPLTENANQTLYATQSNINKTIIDENEFAYNAGMMRQLSNTQSTSSSLLNL